MEVQSVVIHEIIKEPAQTGATLFLSNEILSIEDTIIIRMINSLDSSFVKKSINRAKFADEGFKEKINDFSNFDILETSKILTRSLKETIQGIASAKGGYLVFTEFTYTDNFLAIFLVRNTDGTKLIQSGESWDINSTQYLNVEQFAMGVKINLTKYNNTSEDRYISLVKGNTDIAGYFENWVGISDTKQENKDAVALYNLTNVIELPSGMNDRDELKRTIFEFAKNQTSNRVNLNTLSEFLYGDETRIQNYCNEHDIDIDSEFKLRGTNLSRFFKVSAKAEGIEITAPRSFFNDENKVTMQENSITIESQALLAEIRNILNSNIDD